MGNKTKSNISIIIPVYNAERTIVRCLSSIIDTTYENYEIIVIDDGSTDGSVALIKEIMKINNNIVLLMQENMGPSAARNRGLEVAQGDVIAFVDSDDYVNSDYIIQIANAFNDTATEVLFFGFDRVSANGDIVSKHMLPKKKNNYYHNLVELSKQDIFGYTWIKAFRRNVIGDNRFDNTIKLYEDEIFSCQVLRKPVNLTYLNESLYCYVRENGTLANRTNQDFCKINNYVWNEWSAILKDEKIKTEVMRNKANQMSRNSKWYVLDRDVNAVAFYKEFANSDYIKFNTLNDPIINWIQKRKWHLVFLYHSYYKCKVALANFLSKRL